MKKGRRKNVNERSRSVYSCRRDFVRIDNLSLSYVSFFQSSVLRFNISEIPTKINIRGVMPLDGISSSAIL